MDGWMDGWMNGWMEDGWMDGWMGVCVYICMCIYKSLGAIKSTSGHGCHFSDISIFLKSRRAATQRAR